MVGKAETAPIFVQTNAPTWFAKEMISVIFASFPEPFSYLYVRIIDITQPQQMLPFLPA